MKTLKSLTVQLQPDQTGQTLGTVQVGVLIGDTTDTALEKSYGKQFQLTDGCVSGADALFAQLVAKIKSDEGIS